MEAIDVQSRHFKLFSRRRAHRGSLSGLSYEPSEHRRADGLDLCRYKEGLRIMSLKYGMLILLLCFACTAEALAQPERRTANPHGSLNLACASCHTATSWKPIRAIPEFNHHRDTRYPLRGMHTAAACASCHVDLVFKAAATACSSCHADIHRRQFGSSCDNCHNEQGWTVRSQTTRQHENRFPLTGAHGGIQCESCHKGAATGTYTGLSTACASCHLKDYNTAKTMDHVAMRFSLNSSLAIRPVTPVGHPAKTVINGPSAQAIAGACAHSEQTSPAGSGPARAVSAAGL